MKKFKFLALAALFGVLSTNAFAADTTDETGRSVNGILYKLVTKDNKAKDKVATVSGINPSATDAQKETISIPATVEGDKGTYKVIGFDPVTWELEAAAKCKNLTIDVTNFEAALATTAYDGFNILEKLTITDTNAADDAKTVSFAGGFTTTDKLKEVTLSANIATVGANAFNGQTALTKVVMPGVTAIATQGFMGCSALTTLDISKVTNFAANAISGTALASLTLGADVKAVGADAFANMSKLKTVTINISNDDLKVIGGTSPSCWFRGDAIETLTIASEKVTEITASAFADAKITTIDLSNCTALTTVGANAFPDNKYTSIKLQGTKLTDISKIIASTKACAATLTEVTLPAHDGFTAIANGAFEGYKVLESISIPEKVVSIGASAFKDAVKLATVTIAGKVTSLGGYAFNNCKALASIDLSKTALTAFVGSEFKGCEKLAEVKLPESLTTIAANTFEGTIITELNAPNVTTIDAKAFGTRDANTAANTTLKTLTLGVADINGYTFSNFTALETVSLTQKTANAVQVANNAFYGCTKLATFNFDAPNVSGGKVNDKAFAACSNSPLIQFVTSSIYVGEHPAAPMNSKYSDAAVVTIETVADAGGSGKFYARLCPVNDVAIKAVSDVKVYAVYVDEGTAYFRAFRTSGGEYLIKAGDHAIIKTNEKKTIDVDYKTATANTDDEIFSVKEDVTVSAFQGAPATYAQTNNGATVYNFTNGNYIYRLTNNAATGGFGFTYFTGKTMKAGQFFIESSTAPAAGARLNTIWLDENGNVESDATAIETVKTVENDGAIYNLAGQKVDANFKGVVIKNGKKVILK